MKFTSSTPSVPGVGNGFSVIIAERILHQADILGLSDDWAQLPLGHFEGLQALRSLIGLCWNLTQWTLEELRLPPVPSPASSSESWLAAVQLDLAAVQARAAHSGLRLDRVNSGAVLEVQDTANTAESAAWCRWLKQPIQLRLRLTG